MIHPTAEVQNTDNIGENTRVWQFTVILKGARLGENCNVNAHCFIENEVVIGNNVTIKSGNYIWDGISIEDDVFIGPNVSLTNDVVPKSGNKNFVPVRSLFKFGCSIGAGSVLTPGITIGKHAMIGAGSLVTKNVPDFQLWYGSPAVHKGYVTREGDILDLDLVCGKTKKQYFFNEDKEPIICES